MINSLLGKILQVRQLLTESSANQDLALSVLTGIADVSEIPTNISISDGIGDSINIIKDEINNVVELHTVTVKGYEDTNLIASIPFNELDLFDAERYYVDAEHEVSLKEFMLQASYAKADNDVISSILTKFTTSSKIKATDCYALIEQSNLPLCEARQLIQVISQATDNEGLLSNYQFLYLIKNVCENSKTEVEGGSIYLDETKVFYFKNFLGTAVLSLINSLVGLLGVLLYALGRVIGVIFTALSMIMNKLFDVFSQWTDDVTHLSLVNPESSTYYFDGAMSACTYEIDDHFSPDCIERLSAKVGTADLFSQGSFDSYMWTDGLNVYLNEFFGIGIHPQRFLNFIKDDITVTNSGDTYTFRRYTQRLTPDDVYMTEDEIAELLSKPTSYIEKHITTQMFLTLLWLLPYNATITVKLESIVKNSPGIIFSGTRSSVTDPTVIMTSVLAAFIKMKEDGWDYLFNVSTFNFDWCTQLAILYRNFTNKYINQEAWSFLQFFSLNETGTVTLHTTPATTIHLSYSGYINGSVSATLYDQYSGEPIFNPSYDLSVDSISQDRMFKFNSTTYAQIIGAFALIASVAAMVLIGGTIVAKQIKKFSWKRQQRQKDELVQLRNTLTDPSHTPTKADYDLFYKKQKAYNFKAKLFGWDSFDAGNSWFESASDTAGSKDDFSNYTQLVYLISGN